MVDGDTFDVNVDLGFCVHVRDRLRLDGIDCPEMATPEGKAVRAYVLMLLDQCSRQCVVDTKKKDKYGRYLARVTLPDGTDLAAHLIATGKGKPYAGGKRT